MDIPCVQCGILFTPLKPDSKYHNRQCFYDSRMGHPPTNPKRRQLKICANPDCNVEFEVGGRSGKHPPTKFHSRKCAGTGAIRYGPPKQLQVEQAAYLAGFFDGEGSIIRVNWGTKRPAYRIVIYQSDETVIRWIAEVIGTGLVAARVSHGKNLVKQSDFKVSWTWQLYGQNAAAVLRQLLPYLRVKKERAVEAIAFLEAQQAAKVAQYV